MLFAGTNNNPRSDREKKENLWRKLEKNQSINQVNEQSISIDLPSNQEINGTNNKAMNKSTNKCCNIFI